MMMSPGFMRARTNAIYQIAASRGIKADGFTIATLAKINQTTVERALGGRPVSAHTMGALANALGVGLDDLFEWVDGDQGEGEGPALRSIR